jgi:hypothetical protein
VDQDTKRRRSPGVTEVVRTLAAVLLVLFGCAAALLAWGPLQNLFGYRDSAVSTYLLVGLPWLVVAVVAFANAWRLFTR